MENQYVQHQEARNRFFNELTLQMKEKNIEAERKGTKILRVYLDGEANELQYQTARIVHMVKSYLNESESAPPLPAGDLDRSDGFRQLLTPEAWCWPVRELLWGANLSLGR